MTPEKFHLISNHIPLLGACIALLPLLWGLFGQNRQLLLVGLIIAAVTGWFTPFIMASGEAAYERYEYGPVNEYLDAGMHDYLEEHEERAEFWAKLLYLHAVIATAALVLTTFNHKLSRPFVIAVCVSCVVAMIAAVWIAESGGKIRRPDFRDPASEIH